MIVFGKNNFNLVFWRENSKEVKWKNLFGSKFHRIVFSENLEMYKIGVTTPCGVYWKTCFYQYSLQNSTAIQPKIYVMNRRIFINFDQDCFNKTFYHRVSMIIQVKNVTKRKSQYFHIVFSS